MYQSLVCVCQRTDLHSPVVLAPNRAGKGTRVVCHMLILPPHVLLVSTATGQNRAKTMVQTCALPSSPGPTTFATSHHPDLLTDYLCLLVLSFYHVSDHVSDPGTAFPTVRFVGRRLWEHPDLSTPPCTRILQSSRWAHPTA